MREADLGRPGMRRRDRERCSRANLWVIHAHHVHHHNDMEDPVRLSFCISCVWHGEDAAGLYLPTYLPVLLAVTLTFIPHPHGLGNYPTASLAIRICLSGRRVLHQGEVVTHILSSPSRCTGQLPSNLRPPPSR